MTYSACPDGRSVLLLTHDPRKSSPPLEAMPLSWRLVHLKSMPLKPKPAKSKSFLWATSIRWNSAKLSSLAFTPLIASQNPVIWLSSMMPASMLRTSWEAAVPTQASLSSGDSTTP